MDSRARMPWRGGLRKVALVICGLGFLLAIFEAVFAPRYLVLMIGAMGEQPSRRQGVHIVFQNHWHIAGNVKDG